MQIRKIIFFLVFLSNACLANKVESIYSKKIAELKNINLQPVSSFELDCIETHEDPFYIGAFHQLMIQAPKEVVVKLFEDFENYADVFPGLKNMKSHSKKSPFLVSFEGIVPYPFIPNTHYDVWYELISKSNSNDSLYLFQLSKSKDLKSLDGFSLIKKISPTETLYAEIDFLNADWGFAKALSPKSIWRETISGFVESDYALKFKAENMAKPTRETKKEARFAVKDESIKIEQCLANKKEALSYLKKLIK